MNKLLDLGNRFAKQSDWKDFALTKFCLCAMGVLIGVLLPASCQTAALIIAGTVFVGTFAVLLKKTIRIARNKNK